jgi:putative tryptophan/tyrosine transport system substrate-binding protein
MQRRDFLTLVGGAAATWPFAAWAQQSALPVVGILHSNSPDDEYLERVSAFRRGLSETGYVEGRNVTIEYRWAEGNYDRLPALAADLVRRRVSVIAAIGNTVGALAAKAATNTIPIVFVTGGDAVEVGLVTSLNRPGGNLTGVNTMNVGLAPKRLELLHELIPSADPIAVLLNPTNPVTERLSSDLESAARSLGVHLLEMHASSEAEIDTAFAAIANTEAKAILIAPDIFFAGRAQHIAALALRNRVPAISGRREFAAASGLMSYDPNALDSLRLVGVYTGRILKGEKPADLPVIQPTKVELILNLKTAKALGIVVPITLLGRADEVIE